MNTTVAAAPRKVVLKQMIVLGPVKNYEVNDEKTGELIFSLSATNRALAATLAKNKINFEDSLRHLVPVGF